MSESRDERDESLARIIESYLAANAKGESCDIETLIRCHPEFADDLRDCLGTLEFLREANVSGQATGSSIGDYRIGREIGRGGMGIVYEAEQVSLARQVALKVIVANQLLGQRQIERFQREAEAAAGLHHPNIVPVYAVGSERDRHFYAMQFIEGASLDRIVAQLREIRDQAKQGQQVELPSSSVVSSMFRIRMASGSHHTFGDWSESNKVSESTFGNSTSTTEYLRNVARLFAQAADALDYAHRQGIVHRDVKPSNFLLDSAGKIWLTDFGLAKIEESDLTNTDDMLGTLRYMPPEVCRGETTRLSDLFGLGLTMYEFLALRPAYDAIDRSALMRQVTGGELRSLRDIVGVPRDLETIVMKLLRTEPKDRYASGASVRDDLKRFVEGEPILARPINSIERTRRWCKRNRLASSLAAISCLLLIAIAIGSSLALVITTKQSNTIRQNLYAAQMVDAGLATQVPAGLQRTEFLISKWRHSHDLLGWEWHYLRSLLHREATTIDAHHGCVYSVRWSSDGQRLLSAGQDGAVTIWNVKQKIPLQTFRDHDGSVRAAFWSPDETKIATGGNDGVIVIHDATANREMSNREIASLPHSSPINSIAWSPDGRSIAAGYVDGTVVNWNVAASTSTNLIGHTNPVVQVAWHPDGMTLVSCAIHEARNQGHAFWRWDVSTGTGNPIGAAAKPALRHVDSVYALAFNDKGQLLTAGSDGKMLVWESLAEPIRSLRDHDSVTYCAQWGHGGKLYTGSMDRTIRVQPQEIHTAAGGEQTASAHDTWTLRGHLESVRWLDESPDGRWLASAGGDGKVKIWDISAPPNDLRLQNHLGFAWNCDSQRFATLETTSPSLEILDLQGNRLAEFPLQVPPENLSANLSWSIDGRRIAVLANGVVTIVDVATSQQTQFTTNQNEAAWIQWNPDSKRVLIVDSGSRNQIQVYDSTTGKQLLTIAGRATARSVAWSPCGQLIAGTSLATERTVIDTIDVRRRPLGHIRIWDATTGLEVAELAQTVSGIAWHPSGKYLAGVGDVEAVKVWDVQAGTLAYELIGHRGAVVAAAWNSDGSRLATAGTSRTVKVWDPIHRVEVLNLETEMGGVTFQLDWSADGRKLAAATWGPGVQIWDATKGY